MYVLFILEKLTAERVFNRISDYQEKKNPRRIEMKAIDMLECDIMAIV
jgi:hypothetical protein